MSKRQQEILQALARELEANPGKRITTAHLAQSVGVSEAALYRHFPSKARMFEGLIGFAEETIFSRINQIMEEEKDTRQRCAAMLYLLLGFADRNPGIVRVLLGDALVGEKARLRDRTQSFFDRLNMQFRQVLREASLRGDSELLISAEAAARLLVIYLSGSMQQNMMANFTTPSCASWESEWQVLQRGIFR